MRHIEIYVVENIIHLDQLASFDVIVDDVESCSVCTEDVGVGFSGDFQKSFCVCVDDDDQWIVCTTCASSVI